MVAVALSFTTTAKVVAVLVAAAAVTMERRLGRLGIKATAAGLALLAVRAPCTTILLPVNGGLDITPTTAVVAADELCRELEALVEVPVAVLPAVFLHKAAGLAAVGVVTHLVQVALEALLETPVQIILVKVAVAVVAGAHPEALEETVVVVAEAKQLLSTATRPPFSLPAQFMALFLEEE